MCLALALALALALSSVISYDHKWRWNLEHLLLMTLASSFTIVNLLQYKPLVYRSKVEVSNSEKHTSLLYNGIETLQKSCATSTPAWYFISLLWIALMYRTKVEVANSNKHTSLLQKGIKIV